MPSPSWCRETRVRLLEAERSSVGWPVEVVIIVGQELLGEVGLRDGLGLGLPGAFAGYRESGWLSSLLDVVGVVSWISWIWGDSW
jgi:hypothetical protein